MKTKIFTLFLTLAASVGTMYADFDRGNTIQINGLLYYLDAENKTAEVARTSSSTYFGDKTIPASIIYNEVSYSVTSIGDKAFSACSVTSVAIPNSVTNIGKEAFSQCGSLTTINIPNSVTSIGDYAFKDCTGLPVIENLRYADTYLFGTKDKTLSTYNIKEGTKWIGYNAFADCTNLTSIIIPNGVTNIEAQAFSGCTSLTFIEFPNTVINIGKWAFSGCTALPVIENIRYADTYLVEVMDKTLSTYNIKKGTKWIGYNAFYNCSSMTSIEIPNSVINIGVNAFLRCTSLTSIEIPNSVTGIEWLAFGECTALKSVTLGNNVTKIGASAFSGCSGLINITIPNSVTTIEYGAFLNCTSLTSIEIPNSVTCMGNSTFAYCTGLTSATIPDSIRSIGYKTFSGCSGLTSPIYNAYVFVYMPTSYSGAYAIPEGIELIAGAFYSCTSLTSITIPSSVEKIDLYSFSDCSSLTSVTCCAKNPPTVGKYAFSGVNISEIPLYVPEICIDSYKSAYPWKNFATILPISAKETETTDVKTTSIENSVDVTWPAVNGAYTYELVIRDKNGNVVCTLIFNAQGQLMSITFNAPSRDGAPQQTQSDGFSFTITGLKSGTDYDLTITSKDENGSTLDTKIVSFKTAGEPQGLDDVTSNINSSKVLRDGQILILCGETIYTLQGQEVK